MNLATPEKRIDWIDYAKGISILLVVMMHSTLGVGEDLAATGWMHAAVEFARPFRIPAFFLLSGLFAARALKKPLPLFIDTKIVHYLYFYILWVIIQIAFRTPFIYADEGAQGVATAYLMTFIQPYGTLWFIYMLPVFLLVLRAFKDWPKLLLLFAALIHIAPVNTGSIFIDEFAGRLLFFVIGAQFADTFFAVADWVRRRRMVAVVALIGWSVLHGFAAPLYDIPVLTIVLALAGTVAVIAASRLLADLLWAKPLHWAGRRSIVIYLGFFLPMVISRMVIIKSGLINDVGLISLLVWFAATIGAVIMYWIVSKIAPLNFLYARPKWARYAPVHRARNPAPAE